MEGLILYVTGVLTMGAIYAVLALGLNIQWGFSGLFNAGIAGFFGIGAYTTAILTTPESPNHLGGFGLPVAVGLLGAMLLSGIVAVAVGKICLRLRSDYLAIATIGVAEILRLFLKNEAWLTNAARGIQNIPRPFEDLPNLPSQLAFLGLVLAIVLLIYMLIETSATAPWGRTMRAIRDNETAAAAVGKDVEKFRMEAFVFGACVMGLGGALMAHSFKFIGPEATEPLQTTFLVWVMLIAGGAGNNRGAILGAMLVWAIWSGTQLLSNRLPPDWATRASYIRVFLIGLLLQIVLQRFAGGLLPERAQARAAKPASTPSAATGPPSGTG